MYSERKKKTLKLENPPRCFSTQPFQFVSPSTDKTQTLRKIDTYIHIVCMRLQEWRWIMRRMKEKKYKDDGGTSNGRKTV